MLRRWADARGLALSDEELLTAYSTHEAEAEVMHPAALYPEILARSMRALGAQLGVPVSDGEAEAFGASVPDWPAFPDSQEALERLAKRYTLIILSNVDRTSFVGSNKRLGVTFTGIVTAQDVGSYKPSPRNFEALEVERERLGVPEGRLLHVAQSLFHDHAPAQGRGPAHRLDQPPACPARLGCHARPAGAGHARLGVPVDGRLRRRGRR